MPVAKKKRTKDRFIQYDEAILEWKGGKRFPVYIFNGQEHFFKYEALKLIQSGYGIDKSDVNHLHVEESSEMGIVEFLNIDPTFSEYRLAIVHDVNKLAGRKKLMRKWLLDMNPNVVAVLLTSSENLELDSSFYKDAEKAGQIVMCYRLREHRGEVESWVRNRFLKKARLLSKKGMRYLIRLVGSDLSMLCNEVDKLCLLKGPNEIIEYGDIYRVVGDLSLDPLRAVVDFVLWRRPENALRSLRKVLAGGTSEMGVLIALERQFERMFVVMSMSDEGQTPSTIASRLNISGFFVANLIQKGQQMGQVSLGEIYDNFVEADLGLRTSEFPSSYVLERLILNLCVGLSRRGILL